MSQRTESILNIRDIKKGLFFSIVFLCFFGIAFYSQYSEWNTTESTQFDNSSASPIQSGKAFELQEAQLPENDYQNKSAEALIREATDIVAAANQIVDKHNLPAAKISAEQQAVVDTRLAEIEQEIQQLQKKLAQ